jgi:hypothetical protein
VALGRGDDDLQLFVHFSADNFAAFNASFASAPDGFRPHMNLYVGVPYGVGYAYGIQSHYHPGAF